MQRTVAIKIGTEQDELSLVLNIEDARDVARFLTAAVAGEHQAEGPRFSAHLLRREEEAERWQDCEVLLWGTQSEAKV